MSSNPQAALTARTDLSPPPADPSAAANPSAPVPRRPPGEVVLRATSLSKCYEIYNQPFDRLKQTLFRGRRRFYREFWALRDVSFEVPRGESIGIVGRNGSGKSTLLQIIAGTLRPTAGSVEIQGRVAALLELGAGFNPEFTGRENVFLNAALLGLSPKDVRERFDEIAAFADIGEFLEQPVKTYSTGMVVRLAFAVQAILEPDVLIVDEALAVGDAGFQMKCYNRMRKLTDQGVSVILVSHDTQTVRSFCQRAIWLDHGQVKCDGSAIEATSAYAQDVFREQNAQRAPQPAPSTRPGRAAPTAPAANGTRRLLPLADRPGMTRWGSGELHITGFVADAGVPTDAPIFQHGDRLHVEYQVLAERDINSTEIGFGLAIRNLKGVHVIVSTTYDEGRKIGPLKAGQILRIGFDLRNILAAGEYQLVLSIEDRTESKIHYYDFVEGALLFKVLSSKSIFSLVLPPVDQMIAFEDAAPPPDNPA